MVTPIYRRKGSEHYTLFLASLRDNSHNILSQSCQNPFHDEITLCNLCSAYGVFPLRYLIFDWATLIPYQYVVLGEATQVLDAEPFRLFYKFSCTPQSYEQRCPLISFIWDPYRLSPNTRAQRPRCYYDTNKLSFLERIRSEFSLILRGLSKITTIQLDTQHRMVPEIYAVPNVASGRNIRTRILQTDREQVTYPIRGFGCPSIIFDFYWGTFSSICHATHLVLGFICSTG